jgi:hypothetical protein
MRPQDATHLKWWKKRGHGRKPRERNQEIKSVHLKYTQEKVKLCDIKKQIQNEEIFRFSVRDARS